MMKQSVRKLLVSAFILILIIGILMYLSHRKALKVANETMGPMLAGWGYYATDFLPFGRLGHLGPSWWISYDAKEGMVVGPISIQVSLFGKVIATNPLDLMERLIPFVIQSRKRHSGEQTAPADRQ